MSDQNQLRDSRSGPPPHIEIPNEPNATERPVRSKLSRFLGKVTNGAIKKISRSNLKDSCSRDPVPPIVIEIQDAPPGAKQGADPQSALRDTNDAAKGMNLLSGRVTSGLSTAQKASTDLGDACKFEDTYL
ncbi:uncharacterized protein F5147DRAFT_838772 [Suillus discolor]|uniref:Uncharacterized protein n=1 Tax=Suillus discolor TaxID=1912936 RepID=A0A9P7F0U1_9AGAM|nr:uncharacterized protein F5147DRAFT_838772 [Suillus discolor]KAG2102188.1 hypothetical protein F5147DRAFT_838772 [Suillus discolor]